MYITQTTGTKVQDKHLSAGQTLIFFSSILVRQLFWPTFDTSIVTIGGSENRCKLHVLQQRSTKYII